MLRGWRTRFFLLIVMEEYSEAIIGFFGVITGVTATLASEWFKDYNSNRKRAKYLAVRIVIRHF